MQQACLIHAARAREETFFLGVEAAPAYAYFTAHRMHQEALENGRIILDDARSCRSTGARHGHPSGRR